MRRPALVLTSLALLFAGCGGDGGNGGDAGGNGGGATGGGATNGQDGGAAGGTVPAGQELFASTCGSCHTLADAETSGTFGPDLDDLAPDEQRVLDAIESGPGSMPAGLLEGAEAQTVAEYVAGATGS